MTAPADLPGDPDAWIDLAYDILRELNDGREPYAASVMPMANALQKRLEPRLDKLREAPVQDRGAVSEKAGEAMSATVTKADREAAVECVGFMCPFPHLTRVWVETGDDFPDNGDDGGDYLQPDGAEAFYVSAKVIATARQQGREQERADVVAWLRSVEGWRAPKLAESIEDECHDGSAELAAMRAAKETP